AVTGASVPVTFGPPARGAPPEAFGIGLIAGDRAGYANLNELLTKLHLGGQGALSVTDLVEHADGLFCLSGDRDGFATRLFANRRLNDVQANLRALRGVYRDRLFVQVYHGRAPGDARRRDYLRALARDQGLPLVAAPDARLLESEDFPLLDAMVCARLGIDVTTPHPARPRNDGAVLLSPEAYGHLIPFPDALANASRIARECALDLIPERLTPPGGHVPEHLTPQQYLESVAYTAISRVYPPERWEAARERLAYELSVVENLGLASFFLTAREVALYCERQGILAAGRGSAAASVLCRLLGVTRIDPLAHDLMFERFLYQGKKAMPDVDFDISSARRREVIEWVERRWGASAEAMVAARLTYRLPSAVQDLGRALGLPPETRDRLSRALGRDYRHLRPHRAREAMPVFDEVLGTAAVRHQLVDLMERMEPGFVRQLNPHSGGVVISDAPLTHFSYLARSSGGIKTLAFDKDDAEDLGLIKLDLLGLRMLSALERAREDVLRLTGEWLDFAALPDEPAVWKEIREGDTMGLFQIESPGQVRLSTQLRPKDMTQLAHQVALFRPGPLQSSTVHPYVRRARGLEPPPTLPAPLDRILAPTHGVILFQEQVLRILALVCGLDWPEAERVRKRLANSEDGAEEAELRELFVEAARRHSGWSEEDARACFAACAVFKGYGFAESHAWAFAQHTYASAWVRHHHPAAYWAAVLTEHPGMWPAHTLASEARRFGVRLLPVDVNRSGVRHHAESRHAIRLPLTGVDGVSEDAAREVVMERHARGRFTDLDDFHARVRLDRDALEKLALAGALDALHEPGGDARAA
ncbi:DNA polymerase III subunit alpha, partial [Deinococcus pimensis]|uniref:DNA polymerase III subunit alpha n=1 Tax=Deinococcus pimensis TaxID=309888 RepID=UPI000A024BDF